MKIKSHRERCFGESEIIVFGGATEVLSRKPGKLLQLSLFSCSVYEFQQLDFTVKDTEYSFLKHQKLCKILFDLNWLSYKFQEFVYYSDLRLLCLHFGTTLKSVGKSALSCFQSIIARHISESNLIITTWYTDNLICLNFVT